MKLNKLFFVINTQGTGNIESNCATGELLFDPTELQANDLQACRSTLELAYSAVSKFKCKIIFWFEVKDDLEREDYAKL